MTYNCLSRTTPVALRNKEKIEFHRRRHQHRIVIYLIERYTSKFLLPFHLAEHVFRSLEEVGNLRSLVVPLRGVEHPYFRVLGYKLANLRDWEDNLFERSVMPHDLKRTRTLVPTSPENIIHCKQQYLYLSRVSCIILQRFIDFRIRVILLGRLQHHRQFLVVLRQLVAEDVYIMSNLQRTS